jgi:hypothetical protein
MNSRQITAIMKRRFPTVVAEERRAYRALMNDPAVLANIKAPHTPALKAKWEAAAAAYAACVDRL